MAIMIKAFLLIRPHNVAAALLCVASGFWMAAWPARVPLALLFAVALVTAAGNVINDCCDRDIDRINKPRRVIPSGGMTVRVAFSVYISMLLLLGVTLFFMSPPQAAWIAAWALLLHLYSARLKRVYLAGNILVSLVTASGFTLGAWAGADIRQGVLPSIYTFFFVMGRELVKDCEDMEGDGTCGARTVPVVSGRAAAMNMAAAIFILLAASFPIPYFAGIYNHAYGAIMLISVLPILAISSIFALRGRNPWLISLMLKIGMYFGIAAFLLGTIM
jgi:geranylgeranylglycerol-phosphate geranylgeranyltransferase